MRVFRLIVVEDNDNDFVLIQMALGEFFESSMSITRATTIASLKDIMLHNDPFDLILLDLGLPDSVGMGTLQTVQALAPSSIIVVLSGAPMGPTDLQKEIILADDVISKDEISNLAIRIMPAIRRARERSSNHADLSHKLDQLKAVLTTSMASIEAITRDHAVVRRAVFGNGDKSNSLATRVGNNTRVISYIQKVFWLIVGGFISVGATAALSWLWAYVSKGT